MGALQSFRGRMLTTASADSTQTNPMHGSRKNSVSFLRIGIRNVGNESRHA